jgi:hypothetical protein
MGGVGWESVCFCSRPLRGGNANTHSQYKTRTKKKTDTATHTRELIAFNKYDLVKSGRF